VDWLFRTDEAPAGTMNMLLVSTSSADAEHFQVRVDSTNLRVRCFDSDSVSVLDQTVATPAGFFGDWIRATLISFQNGANVAVELHVYEPGSSTPLASIVTSIASSDSGSPIRVAATADLQARQFGHITFSDGTTADPFTDGADGGYAGEAAGRRIERLCGENDIGIGFINVGNLDETAPMGPQKPKTLPELLFECAEADLGILYEPRGNLALTYRTRVSMYNQGPALELDYTGSVFAALPEPVDDDQLIRNDVTVTREEGSSARVAMESGPLSVQLPPTGVGVYDTDVTVNVVGDEFLSNVASWLLSLGTVDEARYPRIALGLHFPAFDFSAGANLAAPGTFESTLESWAAGGSVPPTVTRDSTRAHSGTWSMKIVWGTGGLFPQSAKTISGLTVGARYQVTGWAWVTAGSPSVRFAVATVSPAGQSTVTEATWERFTFKFTATATSHSLQVWPERDPVSGESAWVDDVTFQVTEIGDDVTGLDVGDKLSVTDLPSWLPPDDVALLAQGFTETLTDFTWDIEVNCVAASPYAITEAESTTGSTVNKADTAGSELASGINTTATSLSVTTTIGPVWTDANAEDGFDIYIGGERMTVTDISGTSSPQTFTVTRSVNGVVKSHLAGAAVRLWTPPRLGL
jgi:hypothetical protein